MKIIELRFMDEYYSEESDRLFVLDTSKNRALIAEFEEELEKLHWNESKYESTGELISAYYIHKFECVLNGEIETIVIDV